MSHNSRASHDNLSAINDTRMEFSVSDFQVVIKEFPPGGLQIKLIIVSLYHKDIID